MRETEEQKSYQRVAKQTLVNLTGPVQALILEAREEAESLDALREPALAYIDAAADCAQFAREQGVEWIRRASVVGPTISSSVNAIMSTSANAREGNQRSNAFKVERWREERAQFAQRTQDEADGLARALLDAKRQLDLAEQRLDVEASLTAPLTLEESITLGRMKTDFIRQGAERTLQLLRAAFDTRSAQLPLVAEAAQHVLDEAGKTRRSRSATEISKLDQATNAINVLLGRIASDRRPADLERLAMLRNSHLSPIFIATIGARASDYTREQFAVIMNDLSKRPTHLPSWHMRHAASL